MEELISIMGALLGLVGVAGTLLSRYRTSIKKKSINIVIAGEDDQKEIKISDIDHLTQEEVSQLIQTLSEKKNDDG